MENVVSYYVIVLGLDQISRKDSPENKQNNLGPSDIEGLGLSSVYGILRARILECVAMPFFRDLPDPGIESRSPTLQADSFPFELLGNSLVASG